MFFTPAIPLLDRLRFLRFLLFKVEHHSHLSRAVYSPEIPSPNLNQKLITAIDWISGQTEDCSKTVGLNFM